uniref:Uncharacterized protein n=1 Tax=Arundo donax TaxID=35708 RepID=A0A0A9EJM7_ARUDO
MMKKLWKISIIYIKTVIKLFNGNVYLVKSISTLSIYSLHIQIYVVLGKVQPIFAKVLLLSANIVGLTK